MKVIGVFLLVTFAYTFAQYDPHYVENRSVMVHLMDWKFTDIAVECERFLSRKGYAGIQLSPVAEHRVSPGRPWWERYQPISYNIISRSGNEKEFLDMTRRCNAVGVRIYVDIILNHMSAAIEESPTGSTIGIGGSEANPGNRDFPAVPYTAEHFNTPKCEIDDWGNVPMIRNCNLVGLEDLNQTVPYVREQLIGHLNHLIDLGVAGFRVDATKHMWPEDLQVIFDGMKDLNTDFGFAPKSRPFIFQEVIDYGNDVIKRSEYEQFGAVTDFLFSMELGRFFRGDDSLHWLESFGPAWGLLPSKTSFCFVDNHDNQRDHGSQLTYKDPREYKMATAFALAHPHGHRRIMSSFVFEERDQGPPMDENGITTSPVIQPDDSCRGGWVCEHRWRQIYDMVEWRNTVDGEPMTLWWDNGDNQIAFSRGNKGFVVFNNQRGQNINQQIRSNMPAGRYCDIISGHVEGTTCSGFGLTVDENGWIQVYLPWDAFDGMMAIHVGPNSRIDR